MKKSLFIIAPISLLLFLASAKKTGLPGGQAAVNTEGEGQNPASASVTASAAPGASAGFGSSASAALGFSAGGGFGAMTRATSGASAGFGPSVSAASCASVVPTGSSTPGGVIIDWNLITVRATKVGGFNSNLASRIEAIEAIAVYDAVNSILHFGTPYHYNVSPAAAASPQAAAAQAAHDVLVNYFPAQKASLDSSLATSLNGIADAGTGGGKTGIAAGTIAGQRSTAGPSGPSGQSVMGTGDPYDNGESAGQNAREIALIRSGEAVGSAAAADIITLRINDGSGPNIGYPGPVKPGIGQYRPTPAGFAPGINQQWGKVKPFILASDSQFRPVPPPAVGSPEYKKALAEVAEIGSADSKTRTPDQTHIAQFYKQDAELTVNEAARELARIHASSLEDNALIFLLADLAEADARIAIWDAKYNFLFWRPVTSLNADPDGAVTNNYSKWKPLLSTPPHPSYPCGHCGTVEAGFEVLKTFFGDKNTFELHTTTAGEPSRMLHSLSEGEEENQHSRLYGGIHYPFDNAASQDLGAKVAAYVLANGPKKK